jgi:hypothetical protein
MPLVPDTPVMANELGQANLHRVRSLPLTLLERFGTDKLSNVDGINQRTTMSKHNKRISRGKGKRYLL